MAATNSPRQLRAVQKISAVAGFAGIDELEESVTVGAALRERQAWISPWWSIVRKLNDVDVAASAPPSLAANPSPTPNTVIWDLDDTQAFLLRIALAMMGNPAILFVDDIEQIRSTRSPARSSGTGWPSLAGDGTDVVVSASSLDAALWDQLDIAPHVVDLSAHKAAPAPAKNDEVSRTSSKA